jgi:hypothetical protein
MYIINHYFNIYFINQFDYFINYENANHEQIILPKLVAAKTPNYMQKSNFKFEIFHFFTHKSYEFIY